MGSQISRPKCPKCGGKKIYIRYHHGLYGPGNKGCNLTDFNTFAGEHLHFYCERCGYDWIEKLNNEYKK